MPPPHPAPTPGPLPEPTPPPAPEPIPPPEPVPSDAGPPKRANGSPSAAKFGCGGLMFGITTVGAAASAGFGLRMIAVGGVTWLSAALGRRPAEASNLSRSPPPPPPLPFFADAGSVYSLSSALISETVACFGAD